MTDRSPTAADHDQLRPVRFTRGWLEQAEGSVLVEFGAHPGAGRRQRHRGRAALAQGIRSGLGDQRVRDAAAGHQHPLGPGVGQGPDRRPDPRDQPADRPQPAGGDRLQGARARTPSCSTATCCRPTAAPGPPRSPARTWRCTTPSSWLRDRNLLAGEPLTGSVAAVSVGIVDGTPMLDLCYTEDSAADVDMNVVMSGDGRVHRGAGHGRGPAVRPGDAGPSCSTSAPPAARELHPSCSSRPPSAAVRPPGSCWPPTTPRSSPSCAGSSPSSGPRRRRCSGWTTVAAYPEPAETERTFEGNALIKARACRRRDRAAALADDSGLAVDVLNGMPGRPVGPLGRAGATDAANNELLLRQLDDVPPEHRTGPVRLRDGAGAARTATEHVRRGDVPGTAARGPRGENGFGYDPLFVADGQTRTTAELTRPTRTRSATAGQAVRAIDRPGAGWSPSGRPEGYR